MAPELADLGRSLLEGLRVELAPGDGDEAFRRHKLLVVQIHRAALLNQTGKNEGVGWTQFFVSYFPAGRNSASNANLLWRKWRCALVKDGSPRAGVAITHGQPGLHWQTDAHGDLCIDLESMWDDFEGAVARFLQSLDSDPARLAVVLRRWRKQAWAVRPFSAGLQRVVLPGGQSLTAHVRVGSTIAVPAITANKMP